MNIKHSLIGINIRGMPWLFSRKQKSMVKWPLQMVEMTSHRIEYPSPRLVEVQKNCTSGVIIRDTATMNEPINPCKIVAHSYSLQLYCTTAREINVYSQQHIFSTTILEGKLPQVRLFCIIGVHSTYLATSSFWHI